MQVAVVHQLLQPLPLHQAVDERHALRQDGAHEAGLIGKDELAVNDGFAGEYRQTGAGAGKLLDDRNSFPDKALNNPRKSTERPASRHG